MISSAPDISGRRKAAPHPGPDIKREYLDPIGFDAVALAAQMHMDATRLENMLAGEAPIDVDAAVRLGRSLQLNPKIIMERQLAHDFAVSRADDELENLPVLENDGRFTFPETGFLSGCLTGLRQSWGYGEVRPETLGFFADAQGANDDPRARMYPIDYGSRIRVFDTDGSTLWVGMVLERLEGGPLLPFVRSSDWIEWFVNRLRADFVPA